MATGEDRDLVQTKVWNKLRAKVRYLNGCQTVISAVGQSLPVP